MRGGTSSPFPPPCGGWTGKTYLGGPYKHCRTSENGYDQYVFDAKVPDWHNGTTDSGGPDPAYNAAGIDPYPKFIAYCDRPSCADLFQSGCGVSNCNQCFNSYGSPIPQVVGYQWIGVAPNYNLASPEPQHWSNTPGNKVNFSKCHKKGFKNVLAWVSFNGNWGKLSENVGGYSGGDMDLATGDICLIPLGYQATPDGTKYTSVTCIVHMEKNDGTLKQFDATAHAGVDVLSGVKTADWSFTGDPSFGVVDIQCPFDRPASPPIGWGSTAQSLLARIFQIDRNSAVGYFFKALTGYDTITKLSGSQWKGESSDGSYKIITCDFTGSFGTETYTPGAYGGSGTTEIESLALSNTTATYSWSSTNSSVTQAVTLSCTLADPHTVDDVADDAEDNLLVTIPLDNDALYPWREDGVQSVGPLVRRRQVPGDVAMELHTDLDMPSSDPTTWTAKAYTDPAADYCDGSIIGGLKPAGYQGVFDYYWEMWKACLPTDPDALKILQWYKDSIGGDYNRITGWLGGAQFPKNTTIFPSNIQAFCNRPGAWIAVNDPTTTTDHFNNGAGAQKGGVWVCKYAEILELWKSQNLARPAGADRFVYDETKVYAVGGDLTTPATGGTFTPRDIYGNAITIADTSGVWGGPEVGGFYNISQAGTLVTLGTKVFNMPTGWKSASGDDAACFGKLRWDTYPGILGPAEISLVENLSPTKLTFKAAQPYYITGDHFDFFDANDTLLAGNVAVTRLSDSQFTVATAYATIAATKFITAAGKKYYFDTDRPKGTFVTLEFALDMRTNAERARLLGSINGCTGEVMPAPAGNKGYASFNQSQGCIPFTPCAPKVVCYSPNGETFENGVTYPTARPTLDYRYGTLALFYVQQTMTDLLYQPPHAPVAITDGLTELDFDASAGDVLIWKEGICDDDSVEVAAGGGTIYHKFYSHHPLVEARIDVYHNAGAAQNESPTLPPGIQIGWLSPVDHDGEGVAYMPGIVGFNEDGSLHGTDTAWSIKDALCNAANSGCRWASVYQDQLVGCPGAPGSGGGSGGSGGGGTATPAFSAGTEDIGAGSQDVGAGES